MTEDGQQEREPQERGERSERDREDAGNHRAESQPLATDSAARRMASTVEAHVPGAGLGSDPARFRVARSPGKLPELLMEIEVHGGAPQPLSDRWKGSYGVASHWIAVSFARRQVTVRNLPGLQ